MYWLRKSIEPVIVNAPGLGSADAASCAHAGVLARIKRARRCRQRQCVLTSSDIESIHSSAIDFVSGGTAPVPPVLPETIPSS